MSLVGQRQMDGYRGMKPTDPKPNLSRLDPITGPHIYIVAAEKSGDELGAGLARELRAQTGGDIVLSGIGGAAMAGQNLESPVDITPLSILGLVEALKAYPIIMEKVKDCTDLILASNADACVLIDSWGFMIRVARRLKEKGYQGRIIKYVAPQVWAMRPGRSKTLAKWADHVLTLHSFDAPYFTRHGLGVSYVGNPVLDEDVLSGDGDALRERFNISNKAPVIAILFGSRLSEIQSLAQPIAQAVALIREKRPDAVFVAPIADTIYEDVLAAAAQHTALQEVILLREPDKLDCFDLADCAIACSGTVTTQLACAGIPSVVCYQLNRLTYQIAKHLYRPNFVSIVNIAADKMLMPEFIQHECTGQNLAREIVIYLDDDEARKSARHALIAQTTIMRQGNQTGTNSALSTHEKAALAILEQIKT